MRRILLAALAALLILPGVAAATTPNEAGWHEQLTTYGGTWMENNALVINRECVDWYSQMQAKFAYTQPWQRCDNQGYPRYNVVFENDDGTDKMPSLWPSMENVPTTSLSTGATSDKAMAVENLLPTGPSYCEFWRLRTTDRHPAAATWGGCVANEDAMWHDPSGARVWPVINGVYIGASGSGVAFVPGTITRYDVLHGAINHLIHASVKTGCGHKPPATRDDGKCWGGSIQYGAVMKLDPTIDVDALREGRRWCAPSGGYTREQMTAFGWPTDKPIPPGRTDEQAAAEGWDPAAGTCPLPRIARMILKAAQTYGIVITDQHGGSPGVSFDLESGNRPRDTNWTGAADGNHTYDDAKGCDGYNNTGQWSGAPYYSSRGIPVGLQPGDWESDCAYGQGQAWAAFPTGASQWYEVQ